MANTKTALKELKKNRKRYLRNRAAKSTLKTLIKKFKRALEDKDLKKAQNLLIEIYSKADKCAKKNIIHWRKAARVKARLTIKFNKLKNSLQGAA